MTSSFEVCVHTLHNIYTVQHMCRIRELFSGGGIFSTYLYVPNFVGIFESFFITFELWLYSQRLSVTVLPTFVIRYFYSEAVCTMLCQRLYVHILRYFFISKDVCSDQLFFLPRFWLKTITTFVLFNFFIQ